jgi:hypothetical protein
MAKPKSGESFSDGDETWSELPGRAEEISKYAGPEWCTNYEINIGRKFTTPVLVI